MNRTRSDDFQARKKRRDRIRRRRYTAAGLGLLLVLAIAAGWRLWQADGPPVEEARGAEESIAPSQPPVTPSPSAVTPTPAPSSGAVSAEPGKAGTGESDGEAEPKPANPEERVTLTFVGDVIMAETVEAAMKKNGYDFPFKLVKPYLERADLTIANLETPVTEYGTKQDKQYAYKSTPLALPAFKASGIDIVNMANNHSMDMGEDGLVQTFEHLTKHGIPYVGAGRNRKEAYTPVIVEKKGIKIAFLGFTRVYENSGWFAGEKKPGVASTYDIAVPLAIDAIKSARDKADLVVVIAHWGVERQDLPEPYQRDLAKKYIDAGADLIVGGHPHVLQGFETYKDKWILYSLGNFIFTTNEVAKTWETIILEASCTKERQCDVKAVPAMNKWAQPAPLEGDEGAALLKRLSSISYGAKVDADGRVKAAPGAPLPTKPPTPSPKPSSAVTPKPSSGTTPKPTTGTAGKTSKPTSGATPKSSSGATAKPSTGSTPKPTAKSNSTAKPTAKPSSTPKPAAGN
ncbi:CapA family protein [Paenibacillus contaminans]|uniref:CapA family protein n=1 Tax=Paenibacillus contaminans TaxID=450362 RepID=A0A329MGZ1_9BACL|nr:CapA family protein [Paenibacillus contaminans]RAV19060.1 CapA family protein [Paenibacillus contaminans]